MEDLPGAIFIIDVKKEETAILEADRLGIPIVAVVDTNCDPDRIDYVIPANDDAIRAIRLMTSKMADAVLEGQALRKEVAPEEEEIFAEDEKYLSAETLARLRRIQFEDDDADKGKDTADVVADDDTANVAVDDGEDHDYSDSDSDEDETEKEA